MLSKNDLIKYFYDGVKNNTEVKIGTEHEKFIFDKNNFNLIPYEGTGSINSIFEEFRNSSLS